jgi:FdhE protein
MPLVLAAGRCAAPLIENVTWDAGYCPVCAAWPTLAELRGLSRERWLRCGRCGAGWRFPQQRCAFCATRDHRQIGYLAPEANRESRRAATCDACRGYLKTISTLDASSPAELAYQDLTTLELDVAALERDYARPETPGFPLAVTLQPAARNGFSLFGRR